jgi:hypothetical protein
MSDLREEYTPKLLRPLHLFLWSTSIVIVIGAGLSFIFENWAIFSRTGSLIVILGLFLAKWDLENLINSKIPINELIQEISVKKNKVLSEKAINKVKENFKIRVISEIKPKYLRFEIYIITIGTLIWGFGDLIQKTYS